MKRRQNNLGGHTAHVNVTPLIDVIMCLIIFYLIVGHLAAGRSSSVDLPNSTTGRQAEKAAPIVINIVAPEEKASLPLLLLGEEPITAGQLPKILRDRALLSPDVEVQIRADKKLNYGSIAPVLMACRDAGLLSVKLVAAKGAKVGS